MLASSVLRWLDRCLGIALLWLLRPFRRARAWAPLRRDARVALLNTYGIGDTVLISAIVADLRAAFPAARIVFFAGPSCVEAARLIPGIDVVAVPLARPWSAVAAIRRQAFDLWIDCGPWPRINALLSFCAKSRYRIGFRTRGQHRHYLYDAVAMHGDVHEIENFRSLLRLLDIPVGSPPSLASPPPARGAGYVALQLCAGGSRARQKEWPQSHWVALIDALAADGVRVVLTGAAADRARCDRVRSLCGQPQAVEVLAGQRTLGETAAVLRGALAVVSVDTGVMHLAAALGCPTIALHGATSPRRWGGQGERVTCLLADARGPFLHHGFEAIRTPDMALLPVDAVLGALRQAIGRKG